MYVPKDRGGAAARKSGADWLDYRAAEDPARWLADIDAGGAGRADERRLRRIASLLTRLDRKFMEGERMIANRTAQLHTMLQEIGAEASIEALLEGFDAASVERTGREDQYGEKCAFYYMVRREGRSHEEAVRYLHALKAGRGAAP